MPVERRPLLDSSIRSSPPSRVEQAELDALGVLREEREVGAVTVPALPERKRVCPARPRGSSRGTVPVRAPRNDVIVIGEELTRLLSYEERHRRLLARLLLVLLATAVIDIGGSVLIYVFERHASGTDVHSFGDALFFTTVQLLTVSSQLRNPLTAAGRVVDVAARDLGGDRRRRISRRDRELLPEHGRLGSIRDVARRPRAAAASPRPSTAGRATPRSSASTVARLPTPVPP